MPARAEEDVPFEGFVLDVALGAGYSLGGYAYDGMAYSDYGEPIGELKLDVGVMGPALSLALTPAYAITPRIALGVGLEAGGLPRASHYGDTRAEILGTAAWSVSAVGILRPEPTGFETACALGYQQGGLVASISDFRASDGYIHPDEKLVGPRVAVRMGYVFGLAPQWRLDSAGLASTMSFALLYGEHSMYMPLTLLLQGTVNTD